MGKVWFCQVAKSQVFVTINCIKWKVFAPSNCTKWKIFRQKKADAEMVSALGLMLWFVISTKMQDRGSCLRYP